MTAFRASADMMPPLPGGYEFGIGGDVVSARTAAEILPKVRRLLEKHRVSAPAELALAEYMCPRMGPLAAKFCTGAGDAPGHVLRREALENCAAYAARPMAPLDDVQRRLAACTVCPKHERHWCITCTGDFSRLQGMMSGRRPLLPADRFSGVCGCARAYEAAVCSAEYGEGDEVWPDAPETCWRRRDV